MANTLPAGSYTINSLLQWNVPLGVKCLVDLAANYLRGTRIQGSDGTYKLSVGRYPLVAAVSRGFMDNSVSASMDPNAGTTWKIEYRESNNAYTISIQDPLEALGWTMGIGEPLAQSDNDHTDHEWYMPSRGFRTFPWTAMNCFKLEKPWRTHDAFTPYPCPPETVASGKRKIYFGHQQPQASDPHSVHPSSMGLSSANTLPVLAIWSAIGLAWWIESSRKKNDSLPPGPKKLPIIGNVMDLPAKLEWKTYAKWAKEYDSDIIHVSAMGTSIVILNSVTAANDLLLRRSAIYSSRPHSTMHHELSGWGFTWALMPYGETWRAGRRTFTKHFNSSNPGINQPRELRYVKRFLKQIYERPNDVLDHVRNLVGSTTLSMTYGIETKPYNDPYVDLAEKAVMAASEIMTSGAFLVDFIPAMKHIPDWVPGTIFHQKAALMRGHAYYVREEPFKVAQEMIKTGDFEPSFVSDALRDLEFSEDKEADLEHLKDVAGQVYIAGADTTASALGTFFLAMVCYPEVQKKAQQELDSVLNGRLPDHSDFASLPYLNAVIKEVYRWQPVTPMGVPHQTITDDVYRDYHIPKGSIVFANQWAMSYDETQYPEPQEFRPERYLTEDGKVNKTVRDPMDIAFGFGRRVCAGRYLAHSTITLAAASVLSMFDLLKAVDENGKEIEPTREYHLAMISRPLEFPCRIQPRSKEAEEAIRACPLTFAKSASG